MVDKNLYYQPVILGLKHGVIFPKPLTFWEKIKFAFSFIKNIPQDFKYKKRLKEESGSNLNEQIQACSARRIPKRAVAALKKRTSAKRTTNKTAGKTTKLQSK